MPDNRFFEKLISFVDKLSKYKTTVMTMAVVVVFVVTYLLILPAFTLEKTEAEKQGGIDINTQVSAGMSEESTDINGDESDAEAADTYESSDSDEADTVTNAKVTSDAKKNTNPGSDKSGKAAVKSEAETPETATATDREEAETIVSRDDLAGSLTFEGEGFSVAVEDTAGILPSDTSVEAAELVEEPTEGTKAERKAAAEEYRNYYDKALEAINDEANVETEKKISFVKFYDITLQSGENAIQPEKPVNVTISYDKQQQKDLKVEEKKDVRIIHFAEDEKTGEITAEILDDKDVDVTLEKSRITDTTFEAEGFSVYGIVYTVDFRWDTGGKSFEFSIPGGSYTSFTKLVETLGITDQDVYAFVANVEYIEFSDPDLLWVGKAEEDTTVGNIKNSRGLECEYSSDLTEKQISEINAQTVEAGEWSLISLKPFDTEETLTVTMKNGEQFDVKVTDGQISANILTSDGLDFCITATFDETAEIPRGTILQAEEIEPATDEYLQYLGRTWSEVNRAYSEQKNPNESDNKTSEGNTINLNMARFFDLKLIYNGEEIEPKAPVQVDIAYADGLPSWENTKPGVVHFTKEGEAEILEEVKTDIKDDVAVRFLYEQDSFSVIGTYIQQETRDVETPPHVSKFTPVSTSAAIRSMSSDGAITDGENIVVPPVTLRGAGQQESSYEDDNSDLQKPEGNKTLVPNNDGTYTLTLSVKGHSQSVLQQRQKKANVLFVMDRSSSMITNTVSDEEQFWYYGTWNTSETTFRGDVHPGTGYKFYGVIDGEYVELNTDYEYYWGPYLQTGHWGWNQYHLRYLNGSTFVDYPENYPVYVKSKTTRLYAEQEALNEVVNNLLSYNSAETPDTVEIALISFAYRRGDLNAWASETEHTSWVTGVGEDDDLSVLLNTIDSNHYDSGTNWEEALQYAYEVISDKEQAEVGKPEEDYYVIFLTDGEPTNTANAMADPDNPESPGNGDNMTCYEAAKDEARDLAKYHFYNIFTYRNPTKENDIYSVYLTNYAYDQGTDPNDDRTNDYVKEYYSDAQTIDALKDKLGSIFQTIVNTIGHEDVSITDTLTTDAMTTTVVEGKTNGYVYTVKDPSGDVLYTVTATGDINNPSVTFNVPGSATQTYAATPSDEISGLYSITTVEGDEYKITLADINDETGELEWDLSPVGILMNDCEYSVSFVVWPDQDAYDYVAALNNGLRTITNSKGEQVTVEWNEDAAQNSGKGYMEGGVEQYPSIVRYPNGTYAVLTNTDQKLHYSVVEYETINGELNGEPTVNAYYQDLPLPEPMPLTASSSQIEKVWNVERNPGILAQLLYGSDEHYTVTFDILEDDNPETDQDDTSNRYTSVTLGWDPDANNGEGGYVWDPDSEISDVPYNNNTYTIGTRWVKDFAIPTGLALSTARMEALGLDKSSYRSATYNGTTYYILEDGHDFTIKEMDPRYEFDFEAPIYHPMLVDGTLMSVNVTKDGEGRINGITKMEPIIVDEDGTSSLKVENNLRGYLHLNKIVVDQDGVTPLPENDKKFEFTITLNDEKGRFTGDDIPWYGINGLFYHDENWNYYQADPTSSGHLSLKTEFDLDNDGENDVYDATCSGNFDPDIIGPTPVTYTDKNGKEITIRLYGNQMNASSSNVVTATMDISQSEVLNIANIPEGTTYTIVETEAAGYPFVKIDWEIKDGDTPEEPTDETPMPEIEDKTIEGTIITNRDNHVTYTNKTLVADITIQKTDANGEGLEGAVFQLKKVGLDGHSESDAADIASVSGLTTITKIVNGETKTYTSALESSGSAQVIKGLSDGTYRLYEVVVPAGYISTYGYIQFEIENRDIKNVTTDTGDTSELDTSANNIDLIIANEPGAALPNAGGIGTTIFYVLGSLLVLGCGIYLIARRRMNEPKGE